MREASRGQGRTTRWREGKLILLSRSNKSGSDKTLQPVTVFNSPKTADLGLDGSTNDRLSYHTKDLLC